MPSFDHEAQVAILIRTWNLVSRWPAVHPYLRGTPSIPPPPSPRFGNHTVEGRPELVLIPTRKTWEQYGGREKEAVHEVWRVWAFAQAVAGAEERRFAVEVRAAAV
ncbi:hypothetical protein RRF57_009076 [Xylaria bambusicola]|uniref:Uncharacterized protein n=1 Tax=Xylaria bambusicola TaxID=326684 RepID=A0AAN7Z7K4_9PEZI